ARGARRSLQRAGHAGRTSLPEELEPRIGKVHEHAGHVPLRVQYVHVDPNPRFGPEGEVVAPVAVVIGRLDEGETAAAEPVVAGGDGTVEQRDARRRVSVRRE